MNRAILCSAIEEVVSRYGYDFTLNDKSYYPATICRYPAAFMLQPEFLRQEGRKHGRITYNVSLRLARQGAKLTPKERSELLAEMEGQMMEMFISISQTQRVAVVDKLTIKPLSETVDTHGAVAIEAKADIETIF
jgi:hypothetical protein